jgi:hypothetical protein
MAHMNKTTRDKLYPILLEKQKGEYCINCLRTPFELEALDKDPQLIIEHENNNDSDNRLENLRLFCKSCNTRKDNRYNKNEQFSRDADPSIILNLRNENKFRNYVFGRMTSPEENEALEHDSLVSDGAEFVGCSIQSIKNYLTKMTSPKHGLYTWEARQDGFAYLVLKKNQ